MSTGGIPQRSPEREPDEFLDREDEDEDEVDEGQRKAKVEAELDEADRKKSQRAGNDDDGPADRQADIERKARRLGWKPEGEWRGAKDKWVDAETFLERAAANSSVNRENLDRLHSQLESVQETLERERQESRKREEESAAVLNEIVGRFGRMDAAAYARARKDLEARQRQAVADGDTETFDKATADLAALKPPPAMPKVTVPKANGGEEEGKRPAAGEDKWVATVNAWKAKPENAWFNRDAVLHYAAQGIHIQLRKDHPEWTPEQNLAAVDEEIREKYPERFENGARRAADSPRPKERRGGGVSGGEHRNGRTYADLPPEAKDACDRFVRQIKGYTVEDYLKTYEWD